MQAPPPTSAYAPTASQAPTQGTYPREFWERGTRRDSPEDDECADEGFCFSGARGGWGVQWPGCGGLRGPLGGIGMTVRRRGRATRRGSEREGTPARRRYSYHLLRSDARRYIQT